MKKVSIRMFFLGMSMLLILVPSLILGFYNAAATRNSVYSSQKNELSDQLQIITTEIRLTENFISDMLESDLLLMEARIPADSSWTTESMQPVLEKLTRDTRAVYSLFYKGEEGFIRIATTVEDDFGEKITGTLLAPDSPEVKTVMEGEIFKGRSRVMGEMYRTIYKPLTDSEGQIIAIMGTGISESTYFNPLFREIAATTIGMSGYFFILNSSGQYVLSRGRTRDGEDIMDSRDSSGFRFIEAIINTATASEGEVSSLYYFWKNEGEKEPRKKVALFTYNEEYDWIIAASDYADRAESIINLSIKIMMYVILIAIACGMIISFFLSRILFKSFNEIKVRMTEIARGNLIMDKSDTVQFRELVNLDQTIHDQMLPHLEELILKVEDNTSQTVQMSEVLRFNITQSIDSLKTVEESSTTINDESHRLQELMSQSRMASDTIKSAVKNLDSHMDEQNSSITEITAAIEEMSASLNNVANVANDKLTNARALGEMGSEGRKSVENTRRIIDEVNEESQAMLDILNIINDITEQINLLAMNAAIEAAHAGEKGRGFSIVAGEMRQLAESTANNGKKIHDTLKHTMDKMDEALTQSTHTEEIIESVVTGINSFTDAFQEIADSTAEISIGSTQILEGANLLTSGSSRTIEESHNISVSITQLAEAIDETFLSSEKNSAIAEGLKTSLYEVKKAQTQMITLGYLNKDVGNNLHRSLQSFTYNNTENPATVVDMMRAHQLWVERVKDHLDGKIRLNTAEIGDHTTCTLGHWMNSGNHTYSGPLFDILVTEHKKMHQMVREILEDTRADKDTIDTRFSQLKLISHDVINRLLNLIGYEEEEQLIS